MTGFLLIRHATAAHVGRTLAGRSPGIHLSDDGVAEARALADSLADAPLRAVYTSPMERARETAAPVAERLGLGDPRVAEAFTEVDFGAWTGKSFEELDGREEWRWWNEARGTTRTPGGEAMSDVLARALDGVRELAGAHAGEWVAVVSHCDVIRPLLAHFLGFPLDHILRLTVSTASVSPVALHPWGPQVLGVNLMARAPWPESG